MCLTFDGPAANLGVWISTRCLQDVPSGFSDERGGGHPKVQQTSAHGDDDGGSDNGGQRRRLPERVYLDGDQTYGFAQDYMVLRPTNPSRLRNGRPVPRRVRTTAPTDGRSGGRGCPSASVTIGSATPRQRTARRLRHPSRMVDRRRTAGRQDGAPQTRRGPKVEAVGLPKEKGEGTSGTRLPRSGPTGGKSQGSDFRFIGD